MDSSSFVKKNYFFSVKYFSFEVCKSNTLSAFREIKFLIMLGPTKNNALDLKWTKIEMH
jgi:hypothetical protein